MLQCDGNEAQPFLDAGVRLVWIIWPKRREVDVWQSDVVPWAVTTSSRTRNPHRDEPLAGAVIRRLVAKIGVVKVRVVAALAQ